MNLRVLSRALAVGAIAAAALLPLQAGAFSNLVIFGDSLSDSGNNADVLGIGAHQVITGNSYIPTRPYASGTYSNGDVWATSFAAGLGLSAVNSLAGGGNYAYGGAVIGGNTFFPPSLSKQLTIYLGSAPADAGGTLYVIAGGGNDARSVVSAIDGGADATSTINSAAATFAASIGSMVDTLQASGAQRIIVWDAPNIGVAPALAASGDSALGTQVAAAMNVALAARLNGEQGVSSFDIFNLVAQGQSHGLVNTTDACGAIAGCDPSTYLFWDGLHPTSAGHQIIADAMLAAVPEPATGLMFGLGLAAMALCRRRLRS
jgi:phospholipase/lecithinase/hemolysin